MKRLMLAAAVAAGTLAAAGAASAEEEAYDGPTASVAFGFFSDYRLRGVSLSDKEPVMQGSIEGSMPVTDNISLFAGVWASSLDTEAGFGSTETDIYLGAKGTVGKLGWSAKYLRLVYFDAKGVDFDQYAAELTYPIGPVNAAVGVVYDDYNPTDSTYLYTTAAYTVPDTPITVKGTLGYEDGVFYDDKISWGLGVTYAFKKVALTAEYIDTDTKVLGPTGKDWASSTVVVSLTSAF